MVRVSIQTNVMSKKVNIFVEHICPFGRCRKITITYYNTRYIFIKKVKSISIFHFRNWNLTHLIVSNLLDFLCCPGFGVGDIIPCFWSWLKCQSSYIKVATLHILEFLDHVLYFHLFSGRSLSVIEETRNSSGSL